jgi:hypothetical protein
VHPLDPAETFKLARTLGRPVALGYMTFARAEAILVLDAHKRAPTHPNLQGCATRLSWAVRDSARQIELSRATGERMIRRAIWPMCEQRADSDDVFRAAMAAAGPDLREHDVEAICRAVAPVAARKAARARG